MKDACINRIVGNSMDARMTSQRAVDALANAVALSSPAGTVVHSDRLNPPNFGPTPTSRRCVCTA